MSKTKTDLIIGGRQTGKTTQLIRIAAETNQYIIVLDKRRANQIFRQARQMGLDIRFPITVDECIHGNLRATPYAATHWYNGGVLIDDTLSVIKQVLRLPHIDTVSIDTEGEIYKLEGIQSDS